MRRIDTRGHHPYTPLIPALMELGEVARGELVEIVMDDPSAFNDLKEYLSEQHVGFREIYNGDTLSIEFRRP